MPAAGEKDHVSKSPKSVESVDYLRCDFDVAPALYAAARRLPLITALQLAD